MIGLVCLVASAASALRGSPLGAKIGVAILPIAVAWPIIFRGLDWFDGLGRERRRRRGLGLLALGFLLIGLSGGLWSFAA